MTSTLKILIDTNVLMHIMEYNFNLEQNVKELINRKFEIVVHPYVEDEVILKLKSKGKEKRQAKFALQLMKQMETVQDEQDYTGTDTALLKFAYQTSSVVLTFDAKLRQRCRDEDIPVLSLGKWGRLQLEGYIESL